MVLACVILVAGLAADEKPARVPSPAAAATGIPGAEVTHDALNSAFNYYGRWSPGRTAVSINSGTFVEFSYTGNSCTLVFDVHGFAYFPGIFVQVDNGSVTKTALSADASTVVVTPTYNTLPNGNLPYPVPSSKHHLVRFWVATPSLYKTPLAGQQWTTLLGACKFKGARLAGGDLVPLPYRTNQIEFLGDSHTQGNRLLYTGTNDEIGNQLPYANWPQLAADLLGLTPVVTGFGGHSISGPATNGAPPAGEAFAYVHARAAWNPPVEPKVVVIYQGSNGAVPPEEFGNLYQAYLTTVRKGYSAALIFAICPHNRPRYAAPIKGAVDALADQRIVFLDYSSGVISKEEASDDPQAHFNPGGAVSMATRLATDIASYLDKR